MKMNNDSARRHNKYHLYGVVLALIALCFTGCKSDDNSSGEAAFDPSKPVTVSDFVPKEGGVGQRLVVYGDNFGVDPSLVKVMIGGKQATVISVKGSALYCFVPSHAYSGEIQVSVGKDENIQIGTAPEKFSYEKKMVVGTLCGFRNSRDDQGWKDGTFETCTGFRNDGFIKFDPLHKDHLYISYDGADIQMIDLTNRVVSTPISRSTFGNKRLRSLDFTLNGQYMIVATDYDGSGTGSSPSAYIVKRNADGTFTNSSSVQVLAAYKQCNGASIHPVNGELYFNSYERGQVFRLDMNKYFDTVLNGGQWKPNLDDGNYTELYTIQDTGWEFQIDIHPSGKYAYIVVLNQNYILRTDYNEAEKRFAPPYVVAGQARSSGWVDGVGAGARLNRPYQGVFVKNPDYAAAGKDDQYDFYFCDCLNFCVRRLTPEGIVSTYAGRGSSSAVTDNNVWGTDNGDLRQVARFRDVTGLAYDEDNKIFYILDTVGRTIRTISMEK